MTRISPIGWCSPLFALSFLMGCGGTTPSPVVDASTVDVMDVNRVETGGTETGMPDAGTPDGGAASLRFLARFDPAMGQLAEGIALRDGNAYVGFAPTGQIVRVSAAGVVTPFAQVPIPPSTTPMPNGFLLGLAFDATGNLYAAGASFSPMFMPGVYRVGPAGGMATLFASNASMRFPNGIDFDATGNLYVTDSAEGAVFKISSNGMTVTNWVSDASLRGGSPSCGAGNGFAIGANGIVVDAPGMNVYVANTDRASIVRVPMMAGGGAGTPVVLVPTDCMRLAGADGLTRGTDGALYATANSSNAITRIALDGTSVTAQNMGGILQSPASLVFGTLAGTPTLFITNAAFTAAQTPGGMPSPGLIVR
jgi:hypothetical protein